MQGQALTVMGQVIVSALRGSQGEARSRTYFQWNISKGIALLVKGRSISLGRIQVFARPSSTSTFALLNKKEGTRGLAPQDSLEHFGFLV